MGKAAPSFPCQALQVGVGGFVGGEGLLSQESLWTISELLDLSNSQLPPQGYGYEKPLRPFPDDVCVVPEKYEGQSDFLGGSGSYPHPLLAVSLQKSHYISSMQVGGHMGKGLERPLVETPWERGGSWLGHQKTQSPHISYFYILQETSNRKELGHSERGHPTSAGVPCSCGSFWWPYWMTQRMPISLPGQAGGWSSN